MTDDRQPDTEPTLDDPIQVPVITGLGLAERRLVDNGVDLDETDDAGERRRRRTRRWVAVGAVVAAAAGAGVVIARPWSSDGNDSADPSATTIARPGGGTPSAPELSNRLIVGELPDGFVPQWLNDGNAGDFSGAADALTSTNVLLAVGGATMEKGPWVAVNVQLLDRFDRKSFDPSNYISSDGSQPVTIGTLKGLYVASDFAQQSELAFGPVNDGYAVSMTAKGVAKADMVALAGELTLDESTAESVAWPVLGNTATKVGLGPLLAYTQQSFGFGSPMLLAAFGGSGPFSTQVAYGNADGQTLSLTNDAVPPGLDVLALARFTLADSKDAAVHGQPAVVGAAPLGFGGSVVTWVEGGRMISLATDVTLDDPVALAESVKVADDSEWNDLNDLVDQNQGGPDQPAATWMIAAGELDDGTTWTIEGSLADDGSFFLCSYSFTADSNSSSQCASSTRVDGAAVVGAGGLGVADSQAQGYVGVAPLDSLGAVLRFTAAGGAVVEVPLKVVRDDWPFQAAAIAITSDGVMEVVAADGTILDTTTVAFSAGGGAVTGVTVSGGTVAGGTTATTG